MSLNNKRILEALQLQPLSQEEMSSRHILGRLYGPIATCIESTRNGRLYNKPLWEKALKDEVFLEKVATKALFLELGHPADREETDMKQACACIPEVPKIVDNDLYACVDILDTPNGRLLKTLVDYGFVPGISSRGSGDVLDNNQVDPETFFLETWDIVQLPAVKKARLTVYESLDSSNMKLKNALIESYRAAKEEDKDTMKKALENLNIDIEEILDKEPTVEKTSKRLTAEDIPWDPDEEDVLLEEMPAEEDANDDEAEGADEAAEKSDATEDAESSDESAEEKTSEQEDIPEEKEVDVDSTREDEIDTVSDAVERLQKYDDDMKLEFEPVKLNGKEYDVESINHFIDDSGEKDTLVLGITCKDSEENLDDADTNTDMETETEDNEDSVETIEQVDDDEDSADDNGEDEVIESLKKMVRQKEALETEIGDLRKAKAVGVAKEKELQEKLRQYKAAFRSTSAEAARVPELLAKVNALTEKLTQADNKIKTLTEKVSSVQQLKESFENNKATERHLNEEVSRLNRKSEALEAKLEGQTKLYQEKLEERTNLAKSYKARFIETLTKYVESKASMLGVHPSEITSRLNESYTLKDVDAVCDQILDSTINFGRLPFGGRTKTSARIAESVTRPTRKSPECGYEIDDDLLELAGLK